MPFWVTEGFSLLGFLFRALGFLVVGFSLGRFFLNAYKNAVWQVQIALALGFFGLLIAITHFATPGSAGAFALGAGLSSFISGRTKKDDEEEDKDEKKKKK